jgi:hypothetical protein
MDSTAPHHPSHDRCGDASASADADVVFVRADAGTMPAAAPCPRLPAVDPASAAAIASLLAADCAALEEEGGRGGAGGDDDEALARALADADADADGPSTSDAADPSSSTLFDLLDPTPDVHGLFAHFNALYFNSALAAVSVEWAPRMTLCAGTCSFSHSRGDAPRIRLSAPLLSLRPPSDLKNTLLHEMVHAAIFLSGEREPAGSGGHGPIFAAHAARINAGRALGPGGRGFGGLAGAGAGHVVHDAVRPPGGYRIEAYHSFHAEVAHFRVHHWRCTGACGTLVKRATNRAPQPADCVRAGRRRGGGPCDGRGCWWHGHERGCGGAWVKVAGPPPKDRSKKKPKQQQEGTGRRRGAAVAGTGAGQGSLDEFFKSATAGGESGGSGSSRPPPPPAPKRSRSPSPVLVLDSDDDDDGDEGPIIVLD